MSDKRGKQVKEAEHRISEQEAELWNLKQEHARKKDQHKRSLAALDAAQQHIKRLKADLDDFRIQELERMTSRDVPRRAASRSVVRKVKGVLL